MLAVLALSALWLPRSASAAERHFGFSYESSVQSPGTAELQPWTTVRAGRADYYSNLAGRVGFDFGVAKHLEGAFFWNLSATTEDVQAPGAAVPARLSTTDFQSLSMQLKYKLSDPVADALGCALLVEGTYGPFVTGFEGRLILDEQLGSLLLAANLVGGDFGQLDRRSTFEGSLGATLGAGYFVTPSFVPSLEVRSETAFDSNIDRSVLYLGPSVSLLSGRYWATFAVEPQLVAFKGASPSRNLDLSQNERLQVRVLFGFQL
ncbi:MAG TPA: hypothetical protein VHW01_31960 [Polyangiaceae bacterium]|nr:hypothetical protein [Polyangiaceae bacterium]